MNDTSPGSAGSQGRRTSDLLHAATSDLSPDVDRLVRAGVSRGRTLRRRRRVGASLAAVAVFGVIGAAASVGPGLLDRDDASESVGFADQGSASPLTTEPPTTPPSPSAPATPTADPTTIDALVVVSAEDIPAQVADLLGDGELGPIRRDPGYGVRDERQDKIVHFMWDGTLTTFVIERADSLASCADMVDPANQATGIAPGECVVEDGVQLLRTGPTTADGVTAQGVSAWVHGYIVSALSYNAAEGKDVTPVTAAPPISMAQLTSLVTNDVWFGE